MFLNVDLVLFSQIFSLIQIQNIQEQLVANFIFMLSKKWVYESSWPLGILTGLPTR